MFSYSAMYRFKYLEMNINVKKKKSGERNINNKWEKALKKNKTKEK